MLFRSGVRALNRDGPGELLHHAVVAEKRLGRLLAFVQQTTCHTQNPCGVGPRVERRLLAEFRPPQLGQVFAKLVEADEPRALERGYEPAGSAAVERANAYRFPKRAGQPAVKRSGAATSLARRAVRAQG